MAAIMYKSALGEHALEFAREHLGESASIVKESVFEIQLFLEENPNINGHTDPRSIVCFLRSCKFNIEPTKKRIKK